MPRDRRLMLGLAVFWATCAVLATLAFNASIALGSVRMMDPASGWRRMSVQASPWITVLLLTPAVLALCTRVPITRHTWRHALAWHTLGLLVFSYAYSVLASVISALLRPEIPHWPTLASMGARLATTGMVMLTEYALIVGAAEAFRYAVEAQTRAAQADRWARQSAELERDLAAAKLVALRQQLQPHFLFNALNAVTSLIDERPADAQRLVTRLSDLLRLSLDRGTSVEVSLGDELDLTDRYVAVEQARFGDRLTVRYDVDEDALGARVPSFFLQPLVENAVRHGLAERSQGGAVEIAGRREGAQLRVSVRNDVPDARRPSPTTTGLGLPHTRARLHSLYGTDASITAGPDGSQHYLVVVSVPWRPMTGIPA